MENKENTKHESAKKPYHRPALEKWGTVADLTHSGGANPSGDPLGGSVDCG